MIKKKNLVNYHMGQEIWEIIKKQNLSIVEIANKLNISRSTLYNKFKVPYLNTIFIKKIEKILNIDLYSKFSNSSINSQHILKIKKEQDQEQFYFHKYYALLEDYNILLTMLVKVSTMKKNYDITKEISKFIKNKL